MRKTNTIAALALMALAACLAGCGDKAAEDAAARQKVQDHSLQMMLKQCGNAPASGPADCKHTVRKPGESGMKGY
jgi:predicted small lipoprotein YifL